MSEPHRTRPLTLLVISMSPQPQTRQQLGCASQYHNRTSRIGILSMGVLDPWEVESASLDFDAQGAIKEPGYTHYDT